ncbi:MAG: hypothetical protein K0M66_08310 [Thiobacillus sp.]|nr:hypothetical protein [Thiobacillus sp.]
MQRHSRGTGISTGEASIDAESSPRPLLSFLLDLGVIATFAVAMLALIAMVNPALADVPAHAPSSERQLIGACP